MTKDKNDRGRVEGVNESHDRTGARKALRSKANYMKDRFELPIKNRH